MAKLLNAARLFQALLDRDKPDGATVANDLDVDSFDDIPFITHNTLIAQTGNAPGLWDVTLTVNVFLEPRDAAGVPAFDVVAAIYAAVHAWGEHPMNGIVPGVGAVESVDDMNAFAPASGDVLMVNKVVRQYSATFGIQARTH